MLKRFSDAKKPGQSKSVPEMAVFRKFKSPFFEDLLRGFGAAMGRILAFSIDLIRRL